MSLFTLRVCLNCGGLFYALTSNVRRSKRSFCTKECEGIAHRGSGNPKWKGGITTSVDGRRVVYAPGHPNANIGENRTHVLEHKLMAEIKLGRPLKDNEVVHHINGDVTDNNPDNLMILTPHEHAVIHSKIRVRDALGRFV